jgi:hypothetical protein
MLHEVREGLGDLRTIDILELHLRLRRRLLLVTHWGLLFR